MIEFKNLAIGFNNQTILKNLNGEIHQGELIALMGINGVGKSCFLKTITALNSPISGDVCVEGKHVHELTSLEMAKSMAVVLTDKVHVDFLRVSELIELGRSPHTNFWGDFKQTDIQVMNDVINLLKIENILNKHFSDLSDGQKQKVLLARALAQSPKYLFLDEPTTYLDIPAKVELMKILKLLSSEKKIAVFFSTHDLNLVESIVDKIWLIDSEGVLHKKSPEELRSSGLFKTNFNI